LSEITLEKTHALLEKLAAYVMTELPTRKELDEKLALKTDKTDLNRLERLEEHAFGSRVRDKEDDDHNSKKI